MKHLLQDAKNEIVDLRRRNEILTAQIGVVEVFAAALGFKRAECGMALDVIWALQKEIDRLTESPDHTLTPRSAKEGGHV